MSIARNLAGDEVEEIEDRGDVGEKRCLGDECNGCSECSKPSYRFKCEIIDEQNDEVVIQGSTYVSDYNLTSDENIEAEMWRMVRHFRGGVRQAYEENYNAD